MTRNPRLDHVCERCGNPLPPEAWPAMCGECLDRLDGPSRRRGYRPPSGRNIDEAIRRKFADLPQDPLFDDDGEATP